jgi:ComF family protein
MPVDGDLACHGCKREPFPFTRAVAVFAYGGSLTQAILRFKHGKLRHLARPLGVFLAPFLADLVGQGVEVACPVPLHPRRLRQRGFNQALELLRSAAKANRTLFRIQIACDAISRTFDTPTLGHGSVLQRSKIVAGAFAVSRPKAIAGKRILIVDDVMTTGATLAECTRTLLAAGAKEVQVATLARAL